MATPKGPCSGFFMVALTFSAMMSKARSQLTGANSPFLSNWPSFMRKSGVVRRSLPYWILARK
ncbi:MAG: hypothetical protein EFKGCFLK_00122 [Rhodocyclaceae bacterium]|nr:hypothetical protein [Rhodocyclaceae bacterium]